MCNDFLANHISCPFYLEDNVNVCPKGPGPCMKLLSIKVESEYARIDPETHGSCLILLKLILDRPVETYCFVTLLWLKT